MLSQLTVKNFAIADHIEVLFEQGMTVLSGETGAGKSIILDALGLALGDRADTTMVRHGEDKAEISAVFELAQHPEAAEWLKENDLDDGEQCILRRVVTAEGRSRGYINGQPSPLQHLKSIGEKLIDIHSQHEHQSLLQKENHRLILDAFGQLESKAKNVAKAFNKWKDKEQRLIQLETNQEELQARLQLLNFQVDELDKLSLQEGELEQLEQEQSQLANAETLLNQTHQALVICSDGDTTINSMLHAANHALMNLPIENPQLSEALSLLNEAQIQVDEASNTLRNFTDSFDLNPERLQWVEERLSATYQLARKHRCNPEELPEVHFKLSSELGSLNDGQDLDQLKEEVTQLAESYFKAAETLRAARTKQAKILEANIAEQLTLLEMKGVNFVVNMQALDKNNVSQHGLDAIEFLISTNAGQPPKPLGKVASGGELSRISLAIQVVIAQKSTIPTLVFDEVDVGIGGGTAQIVGRLLKDLGAKGQVICVTHQPQVASQGHNHYFISKSIVDEKVRSRIDKLHGEDRMREVARMLGGLEITAQTLAHAQEMIETT